MLFLCVRKDQGGSRKLHSSEPGFSCKNNIRNINKGQEYLIWSNKISPYSWMNCRGLISPSVLSSGGSL